MFTSLILLVLLGVRSVGVLLFVQCARKIKPLIIDRQFNP